MKLLPDILELLVNLLGRMFPACPADVPYHSHIGFFGTVEQRCDILDGCHISHVFSWVSTLWHRQLSVNCISAQKPTYLNIEPEKQHQGSKGRAQSTPTHVLSAEEPLCSKQKGVRGSDTQSSGAATTECVDNRQKFLCLF